jgi:hypothetical protein
MLITLALVKLVAASMMLWLPFRNDSAVVAVEDPPRSDGDSDDEDGGSRVSREDSSDPHPRRPYPRRPRRGPQHGWPAPESPRRVRTGTVGLRAGSRHARAAR